MRTWVVAIALLVPLSASAEEGPALKLLEGVAARDIVDREPDGAAETFPADVAQVTVFVRIENRGAPTKVTLVWKQDGNERLRTDLGVGRSQRWRSWGRKRIRPADAGPWTVDVLDAGGASLGTVTFRVEKGA